MKLKKLLCSCLLVSALTCTSSIVYASDISGSQNANGTQSVQIITQSNPNTSISQESLTLGNYNFNNPKLFTSKNKSNISAKSNLRSTSEALGNNSPDTAYYIDISLFGQLLSDSISGDDVENWYYFAASDNSIINFTLGQASDQQNIAVLYQLQSDFSTLNPVAAATNSGTLNINYNANGASGYYFIDIIPVSSATGSSYTFVLNDVSYTVNSNCTLNASGILSANTPTVYNFTASLPESYRISLNCPVGENITVTLLDSNSNTIEIANYPQGQNSFLNTQTLTPGNYNVILQSTDGNVVENSFSYQSFPVRTGSNFSNVNIGLGKVTWYEGSHYYIHDVNCNFNISGKLLDSSGNPVSCANIAVQVYDPAWSNNVGTVNRFSSTDINGNFNFTATSPVASGVEISPTGHIYDYAGIFLLYYNDLSGTYVTLPVTNIGNPEPLYIYGY